MKCPVCKKAVKGVSFKCMTCPRAPWIHPRCGQYSTEEVKNTPVDKQGLLSCKNCKNSAPTVELERDDNQDKVGLSTSEKIARSLDIAIDFIRDTLPSHTIKHVKGDGFCMLHAFQESMLASLGKYYSFDSLVLALRNELKNPIYQTSSEDSVDIQEEFEEYLKYPLLKYNTDTADLFLDALGMAYKVNILIFKSTHTKCQIFDLANPENNFQHTLHFVRTESIHLDPVVPLHPPVQMVSADDYIGVGDCMDIKDKESAEEEKRSSESEQSLETIETEQRVETGDTEENVKSVENKKRVEMEDNQDNTFDSKVHFQIQESTACSNELPEAGFNYKNPSAENVFNCLLFEPLKFEESKPLKRVRENKIYTISMENARLSDITTDDDGAYTCKSGNTKNYYVSINENGVEEVKIVHKDNKGYHYKKRIGSENRSTNIYVGLKDCYSLRRYYRYNKTIPSLRITIMTGTSLLTDEFIPFYCVVVYLGDLEPDEVKDLPNAPHGNQKNSYQKPYVRTKNKVLLDVDTKLATTKSPQTVFYKLIEESGGPMSVPPSEIPRNTKQIYNRKYKEKMNSRLVNSSPLIKGNLETLLRMQRDPLNPIRTVLEFDDCYVAFAYTDKMMKDIEIFCCDPSDREKCVLAVDTTFKLCDMWITDTTYRNKRLVRCRTGKHPVLLGPTMFHFTKNEATFRRFCCEFLAANPNIMKLSKIGTDMESAIFKGFKSVIAELHHLLCVRHMKVKDEESIDRLHAKSDIPDKYKNSYKQHLVWDIYGKRTNDVLEEGLVESIDADIFSASLNSLKESWEKFCPGFHQWFCSKRKEEFINTVIVSARDGTDIDGLYYTNDVESKHAQEKRVQCFGKGSVEDAVQTLQNIIKREEADEQMALYGGGDFALAKPYSSWFNPSISYWEKGRQEAYLGKFRMWKPSVEETFEKPKNAGMKPNHNKRIRLSSPPTVIVSRHSSVPAVNPSKTMPSFVSTPTPNPQINLTQSPTVTAMSKAKTSASKISSAMPNTRSLSTTVSATSSSSQKKITASFVDPRTDKNKVSFVLFCRENVSKLVHVCRGNCGLPILQDEKFVVSSPGIISFYDKAKKTQSTKFGARYIHFKDSCLKSADDTKFYAPHENFQYNQICIDPSSKRKLSAADVEYLATKLGIH